MLAWLSIRDPGIWTAEEHNKLVIPEFAERRKARDWLEDMSASNIIIREMLKLERTPREGEPTEPELPS